MRMLTLRENKLTSFPEVLTCLPELEQLDLSYNELKQVSGSLLDLERLRGFGIGDNPVSATPEWTSVLTGRECQVITDHWD